MRAVKAVFTMAYFVLLLYIVFFARRRSVITSRMLNIVPFRNTLHAFQEISNDRGQFNFYTNLLGNFLLFIPLSFVFMLVCKTADRNTILYTFIFSLSIELLQYLLKKEVADVDDIILNVAGAFVGMLVCKKMIRRFDLKWRFRYK